MAAEILMVRSLSEVHSSKVGNLQDEPSSAMRIVYGFK